jgi:glycerol kinase
MKYLLALDQGTTSSRSILFDENGEAVSSAQYEHEQIFSHSGWVEHDPEEIWRKQCATVVEAVANSGIHRDDIAAIGVTNQRETVIAWDRETGKPVHNAIVWQDRRTAQYCDEIRALHGKRITDLTGLEVDAYFSASKIRWILDNVPKARSMAEDGRLAFGTIDSWLVWKLTEGALHITDVSNASRTMLYNIRSKMWDAELMDIFDIPHMMMPNVVSSIGVQGEISAIPELRGIPIGGIAGDQQAALFGQGCFDKDSAKCTYGTGCFLLKNTGRSPVASANRLLTTIAWGGAEDIVYALEGSVFIGGAVVQWLRDSLGIIERAKDVEELAGSVPDNGGVYFVPAFTGLGTPYWDQHARGTIVGLTRGTGRAHIARAALESIAFQTADLVAAMNSDSGTDMPELRVDGGAVDNDLLMQIQADVLQMPVVRSRIRETTALGAAYMAGLAAGVWKDTEELAKHWKADRVFDPEMTAAESESLRSRWKEAVGRSLAWEKKHGAD